MVQVEAGMSGVLAGIAVKAKTRAAPAELVRVRISPELGVEGDWRGGPGDRQVTVLFEADWAAAMAELDADLPWHARRANLLVRGLRNPEAAGGVLIIGGAKLQITGETEPCSRMEAQLPGLRKALEPHWRGGLTARVVEGAEVAVEDEVKWG